MQPSLQITTRGVQSLCFPVITKPGWRICSTSTDSLASRALTSPGTSSLVKRTTASAADLDMAAPEDVVQVLLSEVAVETSQLPADSREWVQQAQQQGRALAEEVTELRSKFADKARQLADAQGLREADQQRLQQLQAMLDEAIDQLDRLNESAQDQMLEDLHKQLDQQGHDLASLQSQYYATKDAYHQELESHKARFEELEAALAEAEQHLSSGGLEEGSWGVHLQDKCKQLEVKVQELIAERDAASMEVETLRAELSSSAQNLFRLQALEEGTSELQEQLQEQEEKAQAVDKEAEQLRTHLEASSNHISELESELQIMQSTDEARSAEIQALEIELAELRTELTHRSSRGSESQGINEQLSALRADLEQARASEAQKDAELTDAAEVAKVLTGELERLGEVVATRNSELQELRIRQEDSKEIEQLQARLEEAEQALRQAEAERQQQANAGQSEVALAEEESLQQMRQQAHEEAAAATELLAKAEAATTRLAEQMARLKDLQSAAVKARQAPHDASLDILATKPADHDQDTMVLLEEIENIVDQLDEAIAAEQIAREVAQEAESRAASLQTQLIAVQEAAEGGTRARQADREQLAQLQRHFADAQAQATTLRQQTEELQQQLLESRSQAQGAPHAKRRTKAEEHIAKLESRVAAVEAENRALREGAARHTALLQQSRKFLSTYMEGQADASDRSIAGLDLANEGTNGQLQSIRERGESLQDSIAEQLGTGNDRSPLGVSEAFADTQESTESVAASANGGTAL